VEAVATENPISQTAYWTLAMRYDDALGERPLVGDAFASRFMNDEARAVVARIGPLRRTNASLVVRHRLIDERLGAELARAPDLPVVLIGCGFDSRAFRLAGGRWVEVDEPGLLAYKESRLRASEAPNQLVRVPIRFAEESLEEVLGPHATGERAAVVLEGIVGYLRDDELRELLSTLTRLFPRHVLYCDLHTRTFLARYSPRLVRHIRELGATFASSSDTPEAPFYALGYRAVDRVSVMLAGSEVGAKDAAPGWLVRRLPSLRDGYCLWTFEYPGG
jgi:methyltransferase (TIGR00027 family)